MTLEQAREYARQQRDAAQTNREYQKWVSWLMWLDSSDAETRRSAVVIVETTRDNMAVQR